MLHGHLMVYPDADISMPGAGISPFAALAFREYT